MNRLSFSYKVLASDEENLNKELTKNIIQYSVENEEFNLKKVQPLLKVLKQQVRSNTYNETMAMSAWEKLAQEAASGYDTYFGSGRGTYEIVNRNSIVKIAKELSDYYQAEINKAKDEPVEPAHEEKDDSSVLSQPKGMPLPVKKDSPINEDKPEGTPLKLNQEDSQDRQDMSHDSSISVTAYTQEDKRTGLFRFLFDYGILSASQNIDSITDGVDTSHFNVLDQTWLVLDNYEADNLAGDYINSLIDQYGITVFSPAMQVWIKTNGINEATVHELLYKEAQTLIDSLDEDQVYDLFSKFCVSSVEQLRTAIISRYARDPLYHWSKKYPEERQFNDFLRDRGLIDRNAICAKCIQDDSRGHFLALYDGDEHDIGNGLFAYRLR